MFNHLLVSFFLSTKPEDLKNIYIYIVKRAESTLKFERLLEC